MMRPCNIHDRLGLTDLSMLCGQDKVELYCSSRNGMNNAVDLFRRAVKSSMSASCLVCSLSSFSGRLREGVYAGPRWSYGGLMISVVVGTGR